MSDGVFNIAKGKIAYYAGLPAANDALIVVLLKSSGLEADDTLNNYDDLAALLAAANDEADATNYARKTVTASITVTVDDTGNKVDIDMPDLTWIALGGVSNNTIGKMLVCYDPDTTAGTDSTVVPLTYHDSTLSTDGTDVTVQFAAAGFARAA